MNWQPAADIEALRERAALLARLRQFFAQRNILEVETPLLCSTGVTDPAIEPFVVHSGASINTAPRYLQSSPEYAMKRLLAATGEPIYQICKAFRDGEAGRRHNPEFSLLEWYRPGYDHHQLMDEVTELLRECIGEIPVRKDSYRDLYLAHLQLDPFAASALELEAVARQHVDPGNLTGDKDMWLDLLMSHVLEPKLVDQGMCFIYDYPASQAALARTELTDGLRVGQRFELYVHGVELANGYCELTDAAEQRQRFERDNDIRKERGQPQRPLDERLISALDCGLPYCSGVALGVDRLLLAATGQTDIRQTMAFDWDHS